MLYRLARPFLFRHDAEEAHEIGIGVARWIAESIERSRFIRDFIAKPANHPKVVAGLSFPNRVGLAAGLDKNAEAPLAWWAFGFGFAELGTITPRPQSGKPRPRLFRDVKREALINRMGFNNHGAEVVARRLAEQKAQGLRPPMPLGISVGKNATTPNEQAADDYGLATEKLAPHADFLTINVSSPNTPGLRSLQNPAELTAIVHSVLRPAAGKPIFVKVAPELEGNLLRSVLDACLNAGATGIIATNTLAKRSDEQREEGGLSGQPLRQISRARVAEIRKHIGEKVPLIGCGGINDVESARAMLDAGADLIQLYSAMIYEGPFLAARIGQKV